MKKYLFLIFVAIVALTVVSCAKTREGLSVTPVNGDSDIIVTHGNLTTKSVFDVKAFVPDGKQLIWFVDSSCSKLGIHLLPDGDVMTQNQDSIVVWVEVLRSVPVGTYKCTAIFTVYGHEDQGSVSTSFKVIVK